MNSSHDQGGNVQILNYILKNEEQSNITSHLKEIAYIL